jgi:hypothetical protein
MTPSPRRLKEHVKQTVSELPVHAARLAVMGVGRALMLTDRVRKDYRDARESGIAPVLGRLRNDAENLTDAVVGRVAGRQAGNGRVAEGPRTVSDSEISVGKPTEPVARPPRGTRAENGSRADRTTSVTRPPSPAPAPKPAGPTSPAPKASAPKPPKPAAPAEPASSAASSAKDLPVSDYDDATIASVRARLRGLSVRQVTELRDYERTHAARADFLRMYENRITKLRSGG